MMASLGVAGGHTTYDSSGGANSVVTITTAPALHVGVVLNNGLWGLELESAHT